MQKITTFLMFDDQVEEAVNLYTSLFENSKITSTMPGPDGGVIGCTFELDGQEFQAYSGGPQFSFSEGMSLMVNCETQEEIDRLWNALIEGGGEPSMCGWLKDRFGVSWQIIPSSLGEMLGNPDREKAGRATRAMLGMQKLDIDELRKAFEGG
jgi:predicted 3-demethylubiquinone-9 3-methyltransferase (glyoxalase superfamily)